MIDSAKFLELLEEIWQQGSIDMQVRSYSGRFMYGKNCVAVVTDSVWDLAIALVDFAKDNEIDVYDLPKEPRSDSMGRGTVYYWPQLEWPEGTEDFGGEED